MVKFVTVDKIKPGVVLARDVYGVDSFTGHVVMLKAGQTLTMAHITKLLGLNLQGVYVHSGKNLNNVIVDTEEKEEIIGRVREIYDIAERTTESLYAGNIEHANNVLQRLIDNIINSKNLYLDIDNLRLYDDCTYNHALGTTILSIAIGKQLRISRHDLSELALSALLHDIGKMQVSLGIIQKPAKLTSEEFEEVKNHPQLGYNMLADKGIVSELVLSGIISHHEQLNGNGYPYGLKGKHIPFFGRIIACADVYDALTSQRPYRVPSVANEAVEYIMGNSGIQFDGGVVKAFLKCVSPYPIGSCVKLSNGETAVVVGQNSKNPLRPKIFLMENPTFIIDLYADKNFYNVVITDLIDA